MNGRKEAWEKTFNISSYEPSVIVQKSQQFINDEIKCVLDIGCGNFRNSIYFAQQGISVDAIDIADMYNKLQEYSEEKRKNITFKIQDINNIEIKKKYQIIIATRIFQYLTKEEIQSLFNIARNCLDPKIVSYKF
ncbi:MAG: methyltransferase domain-containing protein [Candidatus Absconditabacteria bacterium]|nr:methyltransferase domain-containing protein [Candidatus Absconditabacteria bacterium]MDD3868379.1 methyltransferase domain-containing protein [Candidatus Absconditabacteria bacterium]MDD4714460.1 methyltransferase domain-containing protein [Candidatus Absconditabacteria bacterium]